MLAALHASNDTLATIALVLAILCLAFYLSGRWRP